MRAKSIKPLIFFISIIVLVSIACGSTTRVDPTATMALVVQEEEPVEPPTDEPPPPTATEEPVLPTATEEPRPEPTTALPTEEPTPEPVAEPLAYFVEDFEGDLSSWTYYVVSGDEKKMNLNVENGKLVFDLQGENLYVYVLYDEYVYSEVRLDIQAENRGKNTNDVSLVCNYTERYGWYEFNIGNDGLYSFYVYSEIDGGYIRMASGGSTNIKMGRDTNVYTAICRGNELALYINGVLEREWVDRKYNLPEGQVGMAVASYRVLPILVEVDYFSISVP